MFLPLERKPDWKNPPLITLVLVIANVLIFYMWQLHDEEKINDAYSYYAESQLDLIELKAYLEAQPAKKQSHNSQKPRNKFSGASYKQMLADAPFQAKLQNNQVIKPEDPEYRDWRYKRDRFEQLLNRAVSIRLAFNPAKPQLNHYFASLFLHADQGHLWGNMFMLILLGLGIEIIMGRLFFLAGYLISGLAGNLLTLIIYHDHAMYNIGASGAIAGIMGMAIVIYGLRKINFFYFLIIYFDVIRARAIWLLPIYVVSQTIIELAFNSQVNIYAHLGGFFGGMMFTAVLKIMPGVISAENITGGVNNFEQQYNEVIELLSSLELEQARKKLLQLDQHYPNNLKIQQQLFNVEKYNPASEQYHQQAQKLMLLPEMDQATSQVVLETYQHYASHAKLKPRWTPEILIAVAIRMADSNKIADAEKLVAVLLKSMREFAGNAAALAALVKNFAEQDEEKYSYYKSLLLEYYPESSEARHLK